MMTFRWALIATFAIACTARCAEPRPTPFSIHILDDKTGRGVPLVELKTTSGIRYVTDSAGYAAIDDPALLGHKIFFTISSHGYDFPADGFGMHGRAMQLAAGGHEELKIKRLNIAERLYRITGEGIYRDSVLLDQKVPVDEPLLNAQVIGQDSVQAAVHRGKISWFWGDTSQQAYPLGHFGTAGATSELPPAGLAPDVGVNLHYLVGKGGFSRPTFAREGASPIWIDGLFNLRDEKEGEQLICSASVMKSLGECTARRIVRFDDETQLFQTLAEIPVESPLRPNGHPFEVERDGKRYIYFAKPQADTRVLADFKKIKDISQYEGFTCLAEGEKQIGPDTKMARDSAGKVLWAWRRNTRPLEAADIDRLIKLGKLKPDEAWSQTRDASSHQLISLHAGSVRWNAFRKKWVMIAVQHGGKSSFLGEVWYAEADAPEGPWPTAVKIITHDRYSFYNPVQHDFFDQAGGRYIYVQGTYSYTFSRQSDPTPRYDYNQIMYRLDLADERLQK